MKNKQPFNPFKAFLGAIVPNCIMRSDKLTHLSKLCLARLFQFAGEDGVCYPSNEVLCSELATSIRQLQRTLKQLRELELIKIIKPKGKDRKKHKSCIYVFLWNKEIYEADVSIKNGLLEEDYGL